MYNGSYVRAYDDNHVQTTAHDEIRVSHASREIRSPRCADNRPAMADNHQIHTEDVHSVSSPITRSTRSVVVAVDLQQTTRSVHLHQNNFSSLHCIPFQEIKCEIRKKILRKLLKEITKNSNMHFIFFSTFTLIRCPSSLFDISLP